MAITPAAAALVKKARTAKRWSRRELAAKAKCNAKTIYRIESGGPCTVSSLRLVAAALEIDPNDVIEEDTEQTVRKQRRKRPRDGQECMRLLLSYCFPWTRVTVERDPPDEVVHGAIVKLCEVVDMIRPYKFHGDIPVRDEYQGGYKIGEAIRDLESRGWFLELQQGEQEVFDKDYDFDVYWNLHVRPAKQPPE